MSVPAALLIATALTAGPVAPAGLGRVDLPVTGTPEARAHFERGLELAQWRIRLSGRVDTVAKTGPRLGRARNECNDLPAEVVGRRRVHAAAREDADPQQGGDHAVREVPQETVQLLLRLVKQRTAGPLHEWQIACLDCVPPAATFAR